MKVQDIKDKIEDLIDHYTPYRPITDSPEAKGAREALIKLMNFIEHKKKHEQMETTTIKRIEKIELRRTYNLYSKEYYFEIVQWINDYCITISIFREYSEGYELESVGDRIALEGKEWDNLGILIRLGFDMLNENGTCLSSKENGK